MSEEAGSMKLSDQLEPEAELENVSGEDLSEKSGEVLEDTSDMLREDELQDSQSKNMFSQLSESTKPQKIATGKNWNFEDFVKIKTEEISNQFPQTNEDKVQKYTDSVRRIHRNFLSGKKFEDKRFPAINDSLFKSQLLLDNALQEMKTWSWLRPEEIFKKEISIDPNNLSIGEIKLGPFSNQNLANCVAAVLMTGFIDNLVVDIENIKMGYASFQFMKNGEWHYVIVDTLLPYSKESKKFLFLNSHSIDGLLLALIEKAYAKLNGCFYYLNLMSMSQMMGEMGFYQIEKIKFEKDFKDPNFMKKTFVQLSSFLQKKEKIGLFCVKKGLGSHESKNAESIGFGIMENALHHILSFEDFVNRELRFICVKNIWGAEYNWSGPFANNSDDWEKFKDIRDTLFSHKKFLSDNQTTYYMKIENFLKEFGKVYVLRYVSPEVSTFSLKGIWKDNLLAGMPSDLNSKYPESQRRTLPFTRMDSDDRWFNNPQYRLQVFEPTRLVIELSQLDTTPTGVQNEYSSVGFSVFKSSNSKSRIWEMPVHGQLITTVTNKVRKNKALIEQMNHEDNSESKSNDNEEDNLPNIQIQVQNVDKKGLTEFKPGKPKDIFKQSAITSVFLEPEPNQLSSFYTILVFVNIKRNDKTQALQIPYNLKVFSSKRVEIETLSNTIEQVIEDQWEASSAGGPYFLGHNGSVENTNWCLNQQYLLTFQSPTSLKLILQKTGKNVKKIKDAKLGLFVCYIKLHSENEKPDQQGSTSKKKKLNPKEELLQKLLEKTKDHLKVKTVSNPWRKIKVLSNENFFESTFGSSDTACLFIKILPVEGPLLVVPCLEKPGMTGEFKMTIFSNSEVNVVPVNRLMNPVVLGEWTQYNSGGSHVYNEQLYSNPEKRTWATNPVYKLSVDEKIIENKPVKIRLSLCYAEKNWKSKLINKVSNIENKKKSKKSMVNVDSMISIYILRVSSKVSTENIVHQSDFSPSSEHVFEFEFKASEFSNMKSCLIMPSTYNVK